MTTDVVPVLMNARSVLRRFQYCEGLLRDDVDVAIDRIDGVLTSLRMNNDEQAISRTDHR